MTEVHIQTFISPPSNLSDSVLVRPQTGFHSPVSCWAFRQWKQFQEAPAAPFSVKFWIFSAMTSADHLKVLWASSWLSYCDSKTFLQWKRSCHWLTGKSSRYDINGLVYCWLHATVEQSFSMSFIITHWWTQSAKIRYRMMWRQRSRMNIMKRTVKKDGDHITLFSCHYQALFKSLQGQ